MGYVVDSLVIETRTIRCGNCYKVNDDGSFTWGKFNDNEIVAVCDRCTGNCQIAPKKSVSDPLIDLIKESWDKTTTIVQLFCKRMENVLEVVGYLWNRNVNTFNRKWISVKTKKSTYWLCFDRAFTEEIATGLLVNSIYGMIQFYRDIDISHKAEGPNSKILNASKYRYSTWEIFYPNDYEADKLSIKDWVEENREEIDYDRHGFKRDEGIVHKAKAYNPDLTIANEPEEIALAFLEFIKECER